MNIHKHSPRLQTRGVAFFILLFLAERDKIKLLFIIMNIQGILYSGLIAILIISALYFKPLRKTIGLLLIILGALACMTVIGLIFGIPMIIVGGLFLFI
ncbi:MAG: DUF5362 family protein [Patescibacteria group bacterium]